ncbi:MAG: ATP-dependent Clp protease adapter ClpS [Candidatus Riflebacteria bacterium]|nr:ATP-dependent Clp protease adapter ClpS [Candidatus Riflebacteria bacterium]
MTNIGTDSKSDVLERTKNKTTKPPMFKVYLLNDDYTTMDFVVEILEVVFRHSPITATSIMLSIHKSGKGLAGVYTKEIAETKVAQVHSAAARSGFPLKSIMEKE